MVQLYRLSEQQAEAAAVVGVDDIERRQHVHQLTHKMLKACRQASQPFSWLRACGLRAIAGCLSSGLQDSQALGAVLEASCSQVLEVILSTLDRDLMAPTISSSSNSGSSACHQLGSQQQQQQQAQVLLDAVGRYPAGHAPAAASSEELQAAYCVMQALVLLHPKSRSLLSSAQYLQLVTAMACEVPACLTHAHNTLLALLQGNEEAQAMFVTTGGLDMLLTRTLQHTAHTAAAAAGEMGGNSSSGGGTAAGDLLVELLLFLQMLLGWGIGEAVRRGAHPSTQRAAVSLMTRHLGPDAAKTLTQGLGQIVAAAGPAGPAGAIAADAAAAASSSSIDGWVSIKSVLRRRAAAAAAAAALTPHQQHHSFS